MDSGHHRSSEERPFFQACSCRLWHHVNADGFADILISDAYANDQKGRAFFFYGRKSIDLSSPDLIFSGEKPGDCFSDQSGVFTDINNDGYADIVVGARLYNGGDGRVYVFYGGHDMDTQADLSPLAVFVAAIRLTTTS